MRSRILSARNALKGFLAMNSTQRRLVVVDDLFQLTARIFLPAVGASLGGSHFSKFSASQTSVRAPGE
jgi:hypothetical protein